MIVGPNHGVVMNLPPVVGVYAALRQAEGLPFAFPGGVDRALEAVDVRLVGDSCLWAATHQCAEGETYNLTNGEVFSWRDMWPAIAQTLEVSLGEDESLSVADYVMQREPLWQNIVAKHKLSENTIEQIVGESHHYADLCFAHGTSEPTPPIFVSTVKIHQAGFTQTYNSEESFATGLAIFENGALSPSQKMIVYRSNSSWPGDCFFKLCEHIDRSHLFLNARKTIIKKGIFNAIHNNCCNHFGAISFSICFC
jgi:hypothetical protein